MDYLVDFICQMGLWNKFVDFMKAKGFSDDEIDDLDF